jgi:NAD(P)-dependent dehydrogenase (short-subunit alcohol dehydrogenase family)
MNTATKLAIPLSIAAALTACTVLFSDATAAPPASPTNPPLKGAHAMPNDADNVYKSDKVTLQKVTFKNQYQMTVAGNLFLPKDLNKDAKHPAVVVGHPMGAVKEQSANLYATKMAEQGFVALSVDLSFWGESDGQPRNAVAPDVYAETFSAAVDFLGTRPFIDRKRIGAIGVCGSGSGIGRAAAVAFAREGASVVVADMSEQGNQETVRMIEAQGGRALAVRCDVTRAADVKAALDKTAEAFGRLDFAFNNAGIEPKKAAPTADYEEEWNRIIDTNLRGVFLCMKYEIPLILKQGGGAIVNTSSGAGVIGIKGSLAYTAAKHGVIGLTRAAALDYAAQNLRVNAVCPGYIDTPMMGRFTGGTDEGRAKVIGEEPVGRMGKPEEIAAAATCWGWPCNCTGQPGRNWQRSRVPVSRNFSAACIEVQK